MLKGKRSFKTVFRNIEPNDTLVIDAVKRELGDVHVTKWRIVDRVEHRAHDTFPWHDVTVIIEYADIENVRSIIKDLMDWGVVQDKDAAFETKKTKELTIYIDLYYIWYSSKRMHITLETLAHELALVPVLQQVNWNTPVPEGEIEKKKAKAVRILNEQLALTQAMLDRGP